MVLEAAKMSGCNYDEQVKIMKLAMGITTDFDKYQTAPELAEKIQSTLIKETGVCDPYKTIKDRDIASAHSLMPHMKDLISTKEDKLYWTLKAAAVGNVMDIAITKDPKLENRIDKEFNLPFVKCDIDKFKEELKTAKTILYIGDNCGESVFDTLLIEKLSEYAPVTFVVRNQAIINDVTMEDAIKSGIDKYARIISSGSNCPGTVISKCNKEFVEIFNNADIVISKGQGNYETLNEEKRRIYMLLKAKCDIIGKVLRVPKNSYVFTTEEE